MNVFKAASVSKPVAAVAALSLVQAGRLNLDADVNDYLKTWKLPLSALTQDEKADNVISFFDTDGSAPATLIVIHQNGRDVTAIRIASAAVLIFFNFLPSRYALAPHTVTEPKFV